MTPQTQASQPSAGNNQASDSTPTNHVPLQNASCIICRYPIWPGENAAAIIGKRKSPRHSAYTLGFNFPHRASSSPCTQVYEKKQSEKWRLCRLMSCGLCQNQEADDSVLYHIDCYHMVRRTGAQLPLLDMWKIAAWVQPFPKATQLTWPDPDTAAFDNVDSTFDALTLCLSQLPRELQQEITKDCERSPYLRLIIALHSRETYSSLLDPKHIEQTLSFPAVSSWTRAEGVTAGPPRDNRVRIQVGNLGIDSLEWFNEAHERDTMTRLPDRWFVVERIDRLQDSHIKIKGQFLRIESATFLQAWDTASPPMSRTDWYCRTYRPAFLRTIPLEGLTGITAFCSHGLVQWIQPHYAYTSNQDAESPSQEVFHPSERLPYTTIFYPLGAGESIETIWIRWRASVGSRNKFDVTPILVTNFGRPLFLGSYQHPGSAGVCFARVPIENPTHMLLPSQDPTHQDHIVGASGNAPIISDAMIVPQDLPRAFPPPSMSNDVIYLSTASMGNIESLRFFIRAKPGTYIRQCIGIIVEYSDSTVESLGMCRGHAESVLCTTPQLVRVTPEDDSCSVHWTPSTSWVMRIDDETSMYDVHPADRLMWWYDETGPRRIEGEWRAY